MHGSPNCAIIDCIGRMKLSDHQEMLVFTYFLQPPQLNPHQLLMFLLWMERCKQTAFHGSPLYRAATASPLPARPARARWQPGYRTRKKWTGVQKVSSCPGQALRISHENRNERGELELWMLLPSPSSLLVCLHLSSSYFSAPDPSPSRDSIFLPPVHSPAPSQLLNLVSPFPCLSPLSALALPPPSSPPVPVFLH